MPTDEELKELGWIPIYEGIYQKGSLVFNCWTDQMVEKGTTRSVRVRPTVDYTLEMIEAAEKKLLEGAV